MKKGEGRDRRDVFSEKWKQVGRKKVLARMSFFFFFEKGTMMGLMGIKRGAN